MKKLLSFLVVITLITESLLAQSVHPSWKTPIKEFPDGTVVWRLLGTDEWPYKVICYQRPDSTVISGVIADKHNKLTIESIQASTVPNFKIDSIILGHYYLPSEVEGESVHNFYGGILDWEMKGMPPSILYNTKEWTDWDDNHFVFNADGTGTVKFTISKNGYAAQTSSGNAVGSNQYATIYKDYGQTGGLTGGYSFTIFAYVSYNIKWTLENDKLTIKYADKPNAPKFRITTSMDDDKSQKTQSLNASQWVKIDVKYNHDVAVAKEEMTHYNPVITYGTMYQKAGNVDNYYINRYRNGLFVANNKTFYDYRWPYKQYFKKVGEESRQEDSWWREKCAIEIANKRLFEKNRIKLQQEAVNYLNTLLIPLSNTKHLKLEECQNWETLNKEERGFEKVTNELLDSNPYIQELMNFDELELLTIDFEPFPRWNIHVGKKQIFLQEVNEYVCTCLIKKKKKTFKTNIAISLQSSEIRGKEKEDRPVLIFNHSFTYLEEIK